AVGDRLHWRRANSRAAATLRGRRAAIERQIATELAAETARRRRAAPDPAAIRAAAAVPDTRVWSRQRADPELLRVRVGVAEQPATLQLRDGDTTGPAARLADVPFSVDLAAGPLGIAGPDAVVTACARWLVGQLATLAAPADVEFALVLDETRAGSWHWARWLPHVVRPVATSGAAGAALVTGLAALVDRRAATRRPGEHGWHGSWLVVVVDRCGADRPAGLADVLARGVGLGVTALWLGSDPAALPGCSAAVAQVSGINGTRAAVRAARDTEATDAVLDQVSAAWADELARSLAPLVDGGAADDRELPTECTLPAALHLGEVTPEAIADRWSHATGAAATVLGAGAAGIVRVDLAVDGPHVLVAGTTGAGKSELLRTLVIGLAASQPPSELNLLLIDYKGGAAFAECARLPHTAGVVTDLDADLTERALRSLHAELRRREQSFADAGAGDLTGYRSGSPAEPIPRLVIVVDEFAALAEELPDFLPGLIGVAQRGRSLGIHLVLATQRPGTAVSADIRANTALRIALRVTDAGESQDIIGSPAAAAVDPACPGQGWLRTGSTLTAFQAAHASGRSRAGATTARVERLDSWRRVRPRAAEPGTASDLSRLVDAVCEAARRSGMAPARSPWQPPLPDTLPRAQLTKGADRHVITLGRVDLPDEQRQETLDIDLGTGATLLVAGGPRSGRTNALTLLATGAAAGFSPREVHLHVVDGTGALAGALRRLPHATTVLGPAELELFPRLLDRLDRSVAARLSGGAGPVAGQPVLVLLVDGWDAVCAALPDALAVGCADRLAGLLRSARAARLVIGVTGERVLSTTRLATGFGQRLLLGAPERTDSVRRVRERPATFPPGRAVRLVDGALAQFAAPVTSAEVAAIGAASASASVDQRPGAIRIRPLPDHLLLSEIAAGPGLILGLGGDEPTPVYLDPFSGVRQLLIAGPP
ncbi:MAG: segregation ATPase FtsK/SpoIIIE, family, partial [Pseudonocardiales bacterium]|nr:segregation ATPase FtsK/SpoIIIE, family [Pseudonocardiales bacterium]